MNPKFFCGIDISKETLDIAVLQHSEVIFTEKVENSVKAFQALLLNLKTRFQCNKGNLFLCAEQMGLYATNILRVVVRKKLRICMESSLRIKLSMGIQRGKSDRLDAIKIAKYSNRFFNQLNIWCPPRPIIEQLKYLFAIRRRLSKIKVSLSNPDKLETYYLKSKNVMTNHQLVSSSITAVQTNIEDVEAKIFHLISGDDRLNHLYTILTSIPHVGKVTAIHMIITTNEFLGIPNAKKFASYCGIAPFENSSGASLKGKMKISHIANKDIKSSLHIAVLGVTRNAKSRLGTYYNRKVAEGKNKMSVLNAVRNKLVQMMYACVRNNEVYKF